MIEVIAKGMFVASLAILGLVAVQPNAQPPARSTEVLAPVSIPNLEGYTATQDDLKRLTQRIQEQNARAARINGKLDLLLDAQEGKDAAATPHRKPLVTN